ncbi:Ig-like domain-containing protein [Eubacterium sp. MSJ-33]|uniref:Ig-like domain-containing protein n=1 Tax=Eubacterium sp. MSJ-33 TaxID=2841528 RepID=UPI001C751561|nr:Ig-like domain-containing protein [Eubacterium sp. MSJ-33]QWT52023.1 hypothetical protein KP625_07890 [Eubacterium sp. MSJ-33]
MKRNQKKETKSRRPLKRFIALWIVFAMLVVPFANHVGKDDAKAEGKTTTTLVAENLTKDVTVETGTFALEWDAEKNALKEYKTDSDADKAYILYDGKQSVATIKIPECAAAIENLPEGKTVKFLFKTFTGEVTKEVRSVTGATPFSGADYICPEDGKIKTNTKIAIFASVDDSNPAETGVLLSIINIRFVNTAFEDLRDGIYDSSIYYHLNADALVSEAYLVAGVYGVFDYLSYMVTDAPASSETLKNAKAYTSNRHLIATSSTPKTKYAYAAYIMDGKVLEYEDLGSVQLLLDTQGPTVRCSEVQEQIGDKYETIKDKYKDGDLYYGNSENYKYIVTIKDVEKAGEGASGVDETSLSAKLDDGTNLDKPTKVQETNDTYEIIVPKDKLSKDDSKTVVVTVKDKMGTQTRFTCPLKIQQVDSSYTKLTKVTMNMSGESVNLTAKNVTIKDPNTVHVEYEFVGAGNFKNVTVKDAQEKKYTVTKTEFSEDTNRVNTWTLEYQVPAVDTEASTTVDKWIVSYMDGDTEGKLEISTKAVLYDKTPPTISDLVLQERKNGETTWKTIPGNSYTTRLNCEYRYGVVVKDDGGGSGVNPLTVKAGDKQFVEDSIDPTRFWYVIQPEDLESGRLTMTVSACDLAGNRAEEKTLPTVNKIDENLKVEKLAILNVASEDVTESVLEGKYSNKQLYLKTQISSAYRISKVELYANGSLYKTNPVAAENNAEDADSHRFTADVEIVLPGNADVNEFLEQLYIKVYDSKPQTITYPGPNAVTGQMEYIGDILYDRTNPVVKVSPAIDEDKWYQEYKLGYMIQSGEDLAKQESNLESASYQFDECVESGIVQIVEQPNQSTKYEKDEIDVPESVNVAGTKLVFEAKDMCQNEMIADKEYRIKVDKHAPEAELTVNGEIGFLNPIAGTISVNTTVSDNLTIEKATIKIVKPDGSSVEKTICSDIEGTPLVSKNYSLDALLEENVADGKYEITVTVTDKSGRSNFKTVSFVVDNISPVVTVKITDGVTAGKQPGTNFDGTVCDYYYGSDVTMLLTYEDTNISPTNVDVIDNGDAVNVTWTQVNGTNKYQAVYVAKSEGKHVIRINAKDNAGNNAEEKTVEFVKDTKKPTMVLNVNGKTAFTDPLAGTVNIQADVADDYTLNVAAITVQGPDTDITKTLCDAGNQVLTKQDGRFTITDLLGKDATDGDYTITLRVTDKAANTSEEAVSFRVDNTIPVVTAKIQDGTTAGKQPGKNFDGTDCDYFYRSNVSVLLTFEDVNIRGSKVTVTDNGSRVNVDWAAVQGTNKYQGIYTATDEGAHTIRIDAIDEAGNQAVTKQVVFIKDTVAPAITAVINGGMIYNENMGEVDLTSNSVVSFSVNDANEDVGDFNYQLIKTLPDQLPVTADVLKTDNRSFGFADEADYIVKAYSIDRAGNRSADKTVQFRIDKTAPELTISGAASGSTLKAGTTLTFSMTEAFWKDASGTITITRKASDSAAESTYKTIDFKPTARVTTLTESLTETGEYKVTFTGKDRAGHTAEATSYTVRIDTGKPIITLNGVSNNDKTTKEVEFQAQIDEDFYLTKSVRVNATRTYLDTTSYKEKTENIQVTGYNPSAPSTIIRSIFTEDGVYKLQITCSDAAGNEDTQEVSFTIDKTKPVIDEKVLSAYAGTLTSFAWDYDLNDIIYDLTVCDVHMYLNGSEYDGTSEIEDGAYEMKITAEDELGNKAEETVNFNLDTKAPTFIVTGVEDGEIKNAQYDINVSLQLDEDILDEVSLNGSPIEIKDNAATLTVADKGDYKLTMKAHDAAGNVAEKTIGFTYGEKSHVLLYVLIGVGALVLIGGGGAAFAIAAKKKKSK